MQLSPVLIWNAVAIALALIGGALFLWAMFWDRARGRLRCPKCWYDMKGAVEAGAEPPWICSECGKATGTLRALRRTRRRKVRAVLGASILVAAGVILLRAPLAPIWPRHVPRIVLFVASRQLGINTVHVDSEINRRMWEGDGVVMISRWPGLSRLERRAAGVANAAPGSLYGLDPAWYPVYHVADMGSYAAPVPVPLSVDPDAIVRAARVQDFSALELARAGYIERDPFVANDDRGLIVIREALPRLDLDGDGDLDCLLLAGRDRSSTTVITLHRHAGNWFYAGEFAIPMGRYAAEQTRIVSISGHPFLLAQDDMVTGSGVYEGRLLFHDLRDPAGASPFAIPSRGHLYGWAEAIDHEWTVDLILDEHAGTEVPAAFSAAYRVTYVKSDVDGTSPFARFDPPPPVSWRVRYAWDGASGRFRASEWEWTCTPKPRYTGATPPMIGGSADVDRFERFHAERR
ncbi:MAG: hypothetical protein KIT19_07010 [Phycisphaeraceae bacterium]|nr:hypothetical protein [Phycisphaeraceae bacterium]